MLKNKNRPNARAKMAAPLASHLLGRFKAMLEFYRAMLELLGAMLGFEEAMREI